MRGLRPPEERRGGGCRASWPERLQQSVAGQDRRLVHPGGVNRPAGAGRCPAASARAAGRDGRRTLDVLAPIERFWAFPGMQAFYQVRRLFATGKYDRCAAMVARINRSLATDSYRSSQTWDADADEDVYEHEARQADRSRPDRTALLRGPDRRGHDRGPGARAARGAQAVAPPGRPVRLRDRRGAQLRRRGHGRAAELQAAGVRGPPPLRPPVPPRLLLAAASS